VCVGCREGDRRPHRGRRTRADALSRLLLRTGVRRIVKGRRMQLDAGSLARAEVTRRPEGRSARTPLRSSPTLTRCNSRLTRREYRGLRPRDFLDSIMSCSRTRRTLSRGPCFAPRRLDRRHDYNPCSAASCPPTTRERDQLMDDLCVFINSDNLASSKLQCAASSKRSIPSRMAWQTGRALVQVSYAGVASHLRSSPRSASCSLATRTAT